MRLVHKPETEKTDKLKSQDTYDALFDITTNKRKDRISDTIYRDAYDTENGKRSRVEDQLAKSYLYKCAYCERICKADIEHYRPKKKVDDINHDGYYWLCYEWTNLLPSCITCNREGAKHTKFPLVDESKRVKSPPELTQDGKLDLKKFKANSSPLIDEVPLLLHPEIDDPKDFFCFEIEAEIDKQTSCRKLVGIKLVGKDAEKRGEGTIKICKLNRNELIIDRRENVIDEFVNAVNGLFEDLVNGRNENNFELILEHEIRKLFENNIKRTHTLLRSFITETENNFRDVVLPFFEPELRTIVFEAFLNEFHTQRKSSLSS